MSAIVKEVQEEAVAPDPRRLGLLVPASDMVSEVDFRNHLPRSVVFYTARLRQPQDSRIGTTENYEALVASAPEAARSVALANPELLVYSCTSASFFKGSDWHLELSYQIESATGIPAITTSTAVITALSALGARSLFMASPYPDSVNKAETSFLGSNGFQVSGIHNFGCTRSQEVFQVTPADIVDQMLARRSEIQRNDALFITCTGLRSVDVVETLERELERPVVTSNSTTLWLALTRLGVDTRSIRLGRLYARRSIP